MSNVIPPDPADGTSRATALRSACGGTRYVFDTSPIRHQSFKRCERTITRLHLRRVEEGIGGCALLVGPSGTGKTLLQTEYIKAHGNGSSASKGMRILRAVIPSKPTVKSVVTELLHAANHPSFAANESESLKTIRLMTHMKAMESEVVFLDEMTNVHDQAHDNVEHELTDWLKNFIDSSRCVVVLAGLPRIDSLLRRNNQLRRRIFGKAVMSELSMKSGEDWTDFRDVLRELRTRAPVKAVQFDEQILARRFYMASGGLVDYLFRIVASATDAALEKGQLIDVPILAAAFKDNVWPDCPDGLNPFLVPEPDELRMLTESGEPFANWGLET